MGPRGLALAPMVALALLAGWLTAVALASEPAADPPAAPAARDGKPGGAAEPVDQEHIQVPPPPFSEGVFPCSECHADMETNRERRLLEDEHTTIVLRHDEEHRWCLDCHDADDRDQLHLASGAKVPFSRSYLLCGQCHGDKLRDWRAGVHGKRTGSWNGQKKYLLCAHCHDPHSPRFKPIEPEPPPKRPAPAK